MELPIKDRAALAQVLIHSLDDGRVGDPIEVQRAWEDEVDRRAEEIISGRVRGIPAEEVFAGLRAKYG